MWPLFLGTETPAPLMLPDSVQKAHFAETVHKIANLDFETVLQNLLSESVWILLKILLALAIYFVGRWILRRIVRLLDLALEHRRVDISLRSFMRNTVRVIFTLLLVLIVVSTLGVNVTSLIAVFSAATLAIGMALSGTAQNFAGGVMILLMKPYRVGDYISAQGQSGTVREIKLFSTVITTADNQTIYIPNNSIATAIIDNYSTSDTRRVDWTIGISYGDDVDTARAAILAILAADNRVLGDPAPVVWVAALADSSVNLSARAWVKNGDYWNVFFENNEKFYKQLPEKAAGALLASIIWIALYFLLPFSWVLWLTAALVIVFTFAGIWAADKLETYWGEDPSRVVVDEMVGVWIPLLAVPNDDKWFWYVIAAFALFRIFDIAKPLGIRRMESLKGGVGVMMDDVLAGVYSFILLVGARWVIG